MPAANLDYPAFWGAILSQPFRQLSERGVVHQSKAAPEWKFSAHPKQLEGCAIKGTVSDRKGTRVSALQQGSRPLQNWPPSATHLPDHAPSLPWWSLWVPEGTIPAREVKNRVVSNITCDVWVAKAALWYWDQRRYQDLTQGPDQSNLPWTLTSCF